jgi:hypothetical protein
MDTFLDFDSDGDPDLLIGSLDDDLGLPDRLLLNDGTGKLKLVNHTQHILSNTPGTLYIAVADLNGDCRLDVVQAQGEEPGSFREKVYLVCGAKWENGQPQASVLPFASVYSFFKLTEPPTFGSWSPGWP